MCSIVPFMAGDALSTITESTAFDSEEDVSEAAFNKQEKKIWDRAMKNSLAGVKSKASGAAKAAKGNTLGKDKRNERAPKAAKAWETVLVLFGGPKRELGHLDGEAQAKPFEPPIFVSAAC